MNVTHDSRARRHASAFGSASLAARRMRFEPGAALTMFVLVAFTCFLFASLPRLFNGFADDALRFTLAHAPLPARSVRAVEPGRVNPGAAVDPLAPVADRALRSQQALPASLRELVDKRTFLVRSPRYVLQPDAKTVPDVTGLVRFLTIRIQSGVERHIRLVAGHLPINVSGVRVRTVDRRILELPQVRHVPLLQVALSTATARQLRLDVGDDAIFVPDLSDLEVQSVPSHDEQPLAVKVVGLFTVKDPRAPFWFGDPTLNTPEVQLSADANTTSVFGQALVSPAEYATALAATRPLPLEYEYRYFLDTARLDAGRLQALTAAAARLDARYAGAGRAEKRVEVGLGAVLERYRSARAQAETLLAVAAIGLLACALANLGLLGALTFDRRRRETAIARTRGLSSSQILLAQAAEGVMLAAPAALAGWAVAVLAIRARGSNLSVWVVVVIVIGTVLLLVAAIAGVARRQPGPVGRDDVVLVRPSSRRLALEGLIALTAALGVYLLRRRGLAASSGGQFDPYLAAVPVLLGLACGIVALRLYPFPVAALARLARRGRGLAIHLGLSRAARQPEITAVPLLVLLLALAIATFSAVMLRTLDTGQNRTGWRTVGADARIDAPADESLPARLVSRLGSSGAAARAYVQDAGLGAEGEPTVLLALDLAAYERVVAGTPAAVAFPPALRKPPQIPGAVPAVVSANWPGGGFAQVALPTTKVSLLGVGQRTSLPGIPRGTPFAVVPLQTLQRAAEGLLHPNRLYLRDVGTAEIERATREMAHGATISSRAAVVRRLRASPLVESVRHGFRAAIILAALYAAVSVGLMALIAARSRSRDLALVRTMGGTQRETLVLAAGELSPLVLLALILGVGLGIATPYLIAPGLDLGFFTGNLSNAISVSWRAPAAFAAGLIVLVCVAVALVGVRTRHADLDRVLRIGER